MRRSAALRQSILKKAFTGQLVPQDPTDEPVSKLLQRIRAERGAATQTPKKQASRGRHKDSLSASKIVPKIKKFFLFLIKK